MLNWSKGQTKIKDFVWYTTVHLSAQIIPESAFYLGHTSRQANL